MEAKEKGDPCERDRPDQSWIVIGLRELPITLEFGTGYYLGKQKLRPLTTGDVATMKEPVFVRATALMVLLPNFLHSTFLQIIGDAVFVLKFVLQFLAQRETCAAETVWTQAPLLIRFAKLFNVVVLGRGNLPLPVV